MEIIVKDKHPFAGLLNSPEELVQVSQHMQQTIWDSFNGSDPTSALVRVPVRPTQAETIHRSEIYLTWFSRLRGDYKYSLQKALDLMPYALRCAIDGRPFEPRPADESWTVPGKAKPMVALMDDDIGSEPSEPEQSIES